MNHSTKGNQMNIGIRKQIKRGTFPLIFSFCIVIAGCSLKPSEGDGKQAVQNQISQEAQNRIRLVAFHKTNGQMAEVNAVKFYSLEFQAEIEFTADCRWVIGNYGQQLSFRTSIPVSQQQGGVWGQFLDNAVSNPGMLVKKGDRFQLSGVVHFEKKENGWSVDGIDLTSAKPLNGSTISSAASPQPASQVKQMPLQQSAASRQVTSQKNAVPNSASFTTPGVPGSEEIKQWVSKHVAEESHGIARLISYEQTVVTPAWTGSHQLVYVNPVVEFSQPCKWRFRSGNRMFGFYAVLPADPDYDIAVDNSNVLNVTKINQRFYLDVVFVFGRETTGGGWVLNGVRPEFGNASGIMDERAVCMNNLKQIGIAIRIWERDNGLKYPFNVSTNLGGTKELCAPDSGGYDKNSFKQFEVMSNELSTTKVLLCPADSSRTLAANFQSLSSSNVSYQIHVGPNVNEMNPREILVRCPIHGLVLYCDGSVGQLGQAGN
jgi:hypothetical protein